MKVDPSDPTPRTLNVNVPLTVLLLRFTGPRLQGERLRGVARGVLAKAGIHEYVRSFHDGRHSAITNAARHGRGEMALVTIAGHSDSRTTRRYTPV